LIRTNLNYEISNVKRDEQGVKNIRNKFRGQLYW
jgi:hypothetical protein